jgi:hypothetical protein
VKFIIKGRERKAITVYDTTHTDKQIIHASERDRHFVCRCFPYAGAILVQKVNMADREVERIQSKIHIIRSG